jgi:hypothetical protein
MYFGKKLDMCHIVVQCASFALLKFTFATKRFLEKPHRIRNAGVVRATYDITYVWL